LVLLLPLHFAQADKPVPVQISGDSPFEICLADDIAAQPGDVFVGSEVEAWVAVDPLDKNHLVTTWQQDRWSSGGARGLVAAVSFDGGRTWRESILPKLTPCNGGEFLRASDPWVSFAPNGELYHASLVVDRALLDLLGGQADTGRSAMLVQKSLNGGLTWGDPVAVIDEDFTGLNDKQAITADPHDSRFAYLVWDRLDFLADTGPAMFSRTTDGGATWEAPEVLFDPGPAWQTVANQVVVLPDGTLVDFFTNIETLPDPPFENDWLALKRSTDRGETWHPVGPPIVASKMEPSFNLTEPDTGEPIRGGEGLFDVAVDAKDGTLYAVWQDARFSEGEHESIALSVSFDGGLTWTDPVKVNQTPEDLPPARQQAFVPSVAVNEKGDVAITYYDFRFNDGGPVAATNYWAVMCRPRPFDDCADPEDWGGETRLTDESFDLSHAPIARGFFLGDYAGLAAAGDEFVAVFAISSAEDPADLFSRSFKKGRNARGLRSLGPRGR
jgi:hypothetical protein